MSDKKLKVEDYLEKFAEYNRLRLIKKSLQGAIRQLTDQHPDGHPIGITYSPWACAKVTSYYFSHLDCEDIKASFLLLMEELVEKRTREMKELRLDD